MKIETKADTVNRSPSPAFPQPHVDITFREQEPTSRAIPGVYSELQRTIDTTAEYAKTVGIDITRFRDPKSVLLRKVYGGKRNPSGLIPTIDSLKLNNPTSAILWTPETETASRKIKGSDALLALPSFTQRVARKAALLVRLCICCGPATALDRLSERKIPSVVIRKKYFDRKSFTPKPVNNEWLDYSLPEADDRFLVDTRSLNSGPETRSIQEIMDSLNKTIDEARKPNNGITNTPDKPSVKASSELPTTIGGIYYNEANIVKAAKKPNKASHADDPNPEGGMSFT